MGGGHAVRSADVSLAGETFVVTELTSRELAEVANEIGELELTRAGDLEALGKCLQALAQILLNSLKRADPGFPAERLASLDAEQLHAALDAAIELSLPPKQDFPILRMANLN